MQTVELLKQKLWGDFIRLIPKGELAAIPVNDSEWLEIQNGRHKRLRQIKAGLVIVSAYAGIVNLIFWFIFFVKFLNTDICRIIGDKWLLLLSTGS